MQPITARRVVMTAAVLLQGTVGSRVAQARQPQEPAVPATRVLVLYSLAPEHPGIGDFIRQLRITLRAGLAAPVEFYEEFLDLTRVPGSERASQLAQAYREKYGALRFDLIIPVGSGATPILLALVLIGVQTLLIAQLLIERRRRIRAQSAVDEQVDFERLISGLTADLVEHASDLTTALEHALARLASYADAESARLTIDNEGSDRQIVTWRSTTAGVDPPDPAAPPRAGASVVLDLLAIESRVGTLELHAAHVLERWPMVVLRLRAAVEVVASAIARDAAARTARRIETLNHAVLASISAQIAILDRAGNIVRVNDAWRERCSRGDVDTWHGAVLDANYLDECRRAVEHGNLESADIRRGIEAVLAHDIPSFRREYRCAPEERWYEVFVEPLDHPDGGAVVTHLDITDRRLAELTAEASQRQVAHMARVASVGELAATLVHELGQPLTAIANSAYAGTHLLSRQPPDLIELEVIFGEISDDTTRASAVIDRVRSLLRKEDPRNEAVDLNETCREIMNLLEFDAARRRVRLELDLDPALSPVMGDPVQLKQVVLNLAVNGLEATSSCDGRREVTLRTRGRGAVIELSVRDSGRGLSEETATQVFQPFFSTKIQGLGMGLAIVRSIVERHGGNVRAETLPSGGAVFRVNLPLTPGDPGAAGGSLAGDVRDRAVEVSAD